MGKRSRIKTRDFGLQLCVPDTEYCIIEKLGLGVGLDVFLFYFRVRVTALVQAKLLHESQEYKYIQQRYGYDIIYVHYVSVHEGDTRFCDECECWLKHSFNSSNTCYFDCGPS